MIASTEKQHLLSFIVKTLLLAMGFLIQLVNFGTSISLSLKWGVMLAVIGVLSGSRDQEFRKCLAYGKSSISVSFSYY